MLTTIDAHQTYHNALLDFYKNPQLYLSKGSNEERGESICHVSVFGPTTHRFNGLDANCNRVLCYRDIREEIKAAVEDEGFDKVLIEFDGPGGEASGCFDLAQYIAEASKIKPIIGFINGSSYSANYAIASQCSELYASPHSWGGSIGAIYGREERTSDGRKIHYFTSGEAKADGQPYLTMTEAEAARNQSMVNGFAKDFFKLVSNRRNIQPDEVEALQANIYSAEQMLELGLIDGIKTEEEIHEMMISSAKHQRIVDELNAEHEKEVQALKGTNTSLSQQVTKLQADAQEGLQRQTELLTQVNNLAQSAGVGDIAAEIVAGGADLDSAKEQIKQEAAKRDEEVSLTSSLDGGEDSYDMQQLIRDA